MCFIVFKLSFYSLTATGYNSGLAALKRPPSRKPLVVMPTPCSGIDVSVYLQQSNRNYLLPCVSSDG